MLRVQAVVDKYKAAAKIVQDGLEEVLKQCVPNAVISVLCANGDSIIESASLLVYNDDGEKISRGVAFPTSICVNNCICNYSPSLEDKTALKQGDLIKIEMACHIDGFIAVAGTSYVLENAPLKGIKANLVSAAITSAEVAATMIKPGKKKADVLQALEKIASDRGFQTVSGFLPHEMRQNLINVSLEPGNALVRPHMGYFESGQVYCVDIVISTGRGVPASSENSSIYLKRCDSKAKGELKSGSSNAVWKKICKNFPVHPFSARSLDLNDRIGLLECIDKGLVEAFEVLHETSDKLVARVEFTMLLKPDGMVDCLTTAPTQEIKLDDPVVNAM